MAKYSELPDRFQLMRAILNLLSASAARVTGHPMRLFCFRLAGSLLMCLSTCCSDSTVAPRESLGSDSESLATYLEKNHLTVSHEAVVTPAYVFEHLGRNQGGKGQRNFVKSILKFVLEPIAAKARRELVHSWLGKRLDRHLIALGENWTDPVYDHIAQQFIAVFDLADHPEKLDSFPEVPLELMPAIQSGMLAVSPAPQNALPPPIPFRPGYPNHPDWDHVSLKETGCPQSRRKYEALSEHYGLYKGMEPDTAHSVDCAEENGESLARVVNMLSNGIIQPVTPVELTAAWKPGVKLTARNLRELLTHLGTLGLTLEFFNTRVYVDFMSLSYREGHEMKSLRLATWFRSSIGPGRSVSTPGEHGEINFMVRRGEKRIAQMAWFFGVPEVGFEGTAAFWRNQKDLRAPWTAPHHEIVEVYPPSRTETATPWLEGTAWVMRGFQSVYDKYHPPLNSYGLFVCSDSMALALLKRSTLSGITPNARATFAFPMVYATTLGTESLDSLLFGNTDLPRDRVLQYSPPDQLLQHQPKEMRERLQKTYPPEKDYRLKDFADFVATDLQLLRE